MHFLSGSELFKLGRKKYKAAHYFDLVSLYNGPELCLELYQRRGQRQTNNRYVSPKIVNVFTIYATFIRLRYSAKRPYLSAYSVFHEAVFLRV